MIGDAHDIPSTQLKLLQLLADGCEHSGQELAAILGVSRTSIWKQLSKLNTLGVEIVSRPGHGYSIAGGIELLSEQQIINLLNVDCLGKINKFILLNCVDSTNSFLLKQQHINNIVVCMAEYQTAGRGRRGREWISPFAKNIYLSLKMTVDGGIAALEGLSLAVGVAIVHALEAVNITGLQLKWPNDLLWRGQKLGGILIEVVGDPSGHCHLVVGIGLNMSSAKSMENIEQPWSSLEDIAIENIPHRNKIAAALLNQVVPLLATYEKKGFSYYREDWQRLNAHQGQNVDMHVGENIINGIVVGVSETGALILQTEDKGEMIFHGGEVSLRGRMQ